MTYNWPVSVWMLILKNVFPLCLLNSSAVDEKFLNACYQSVYSTFIKMSVVKALNQISLFYNTNKSYFLRMCVYPRSCALIALIFRATFCIEIEMLCSISVAFVFLYTVMYMFLTPLIEFLSDSQRIPLCV